jgi:phage tail-like protein
MSKSDPIAAFRFAIEIDNQAIGAFTDCDMPAFEMDTSVTIKEGGQNDYIHKLPGRAQVGNLTLKHGIMLNDQLLLWSFQTLTNQISFRDRTANITVVMYNNNHKPIYRFTFLHAFPVKWQGPSFKAGENAVAVESIEFAHHGVTYEYLASGAE